MVLATKQYIGWDFADSVSRDPMFFTLLVENLINIAVSLHSGH